MTDNTAPDPARDTAGRVSGVLTVEYLRELYVQQHGPLPKLANAVSTSREVSWSAAHEQLWPTIARAQHHGDLPEVGTPEWLDLPAGDPRRVGAIYRSALLWALHTENQQTATRDASHDISTARDWTAVARRNRDLSDFYREHPELKRRSA
ncbi:DUF2742 domain-containing protein [Williamsia sterculiae]|uniref:DUF2742 domain-containing protein n=1 Tax=Williamsia sterculiae TaxID=1344003 RepID=A0A1N7FE79_9NOCA|nr:DUF2742 domain-containing protein [Williamsia sterculiae]SIR98535.1 Protein of unknown function [Williamsia sterculiae]